VDPVPDPLLLRKNLATPQRRSIVEDKLGKMCNRVQQRTAAAFSYKDTEANSAKLQPVLLMYTIRIETRTFSISRNMLTNTSGNVATIPLGAQSSKQSIGKYLQSSQMAKYD
jgi:hypothetical protein